MTVERRYLCNLCRESHPPDSDNMHGVYFTGAGSEMILTGPAYYRGASVENHICNKCLKALASAARATAERDASGEGEGVR